MRVAVIGAGVTGVACAHELALDGHEVTVRERRGSVAVESSFGPSGVFGSGALMHSAGPLARGGWRQLHPAWRGASLRWAWQWHRAARAHHSAHTQLLQLAHLSCQRQAALLSATPLELETTSGHLLLLRSAKDGARLAPALALLTEHGVAHQRLDAEQCRATEPGLNPAAPLHGGVLLPGDATGNCRQFTLLLRALAEQRGVQFRFHHAVTALQAGRHLGHHLRLHVTQAPSGETTLLTEVERQRGGPSGGADEGPYEEDFDAVILCAAMGSPQLLATLGLHLPLAALWGQSLTAPLRQLEWQGEVGPRATVTDLHSGVTLSRLDSRLRVAGGVRLAEQPPQGATWWPELAQTLDTWFPGAARAQHAQRWVGARATLPDGLPALGATPVPGMWLNLGHANAGWALACGSARVLADQLAGRATASAVDALLAHRLFR
jgi:D-amino-acid dehydrogenase